MEIFTDEGNLGGFDVVLRRPSFEASLILWWEHEGKRKELLSLDYGAIKPRGRKEAARPAASQGFRQTSETIGWQQLHALHVAMVGEVEEAI